ncbi:dialkylrecorsinol condensing enzyme, partial [Aliarcobacter trophiarum LMG 25534]
DDDNDYDLVILPYQVWFLSPSLPITAFLKSDYAKRKLKGKPVITLIGCRNMWVMAQEKLKQMLSDVEAKLIDNIVLIDQGNSFATFVTTPRWMLTGKRDSLWGIFPEAGISKQDIKEASRFGKAISHALANDEEKKQESICHGLNAVIIDEKLIKSEQIATKSFMIWGKLIRKVGKQGDPK